MYDADYRTSKRDFDTFVESLTEKIIEKDETIPELPAKDVVCRFDKILLLKIAEMGSSMTDIPHLQRHTVQS